MFWNSYVRPFFAVFFSFDALSYNTVIVCYCDILWLWCFVAWYFVPCCSFLMLFWRCTAFARDVCTVLFCHRANCSIFYSLQNKVGVPTPKDKCYRIRPLKDSVPHHDWAGIWKYNFVLVLWQVVFLTCILDFLYFESIMPQKDIVFPADWTMFSFPLRRSWLPFSELRPDFGNVCLLRTRTVSSRVSWRRKPKAHER